MQPHSEHFWWIFLNLTWEKNYREKILLRTNNDQIVGFGYIGRSTWNLLHTMAAYYPDTPTQEVKDDCRIFFEKFAKLYPCKSCADHFREQWV